MFTVPKQEEQLEIQVKREHLFILCLISSSKFLVSHLCFSPCEISGCWPIGLLLCLYLQMFTSLLYMVALPLSTNKISSESKFSSFYIMVSSGSYVLSNGSFLIYWIPVCHPPIESFYLFFGLWLANLEAFFHQHLNFTALLRYISVVKPSYMLIDCQNTSQIISSSDLSSFNSCQSCSSLLVSFALTKGPIILDAPIHEHVGRTDLNRKQIRYWTI